MAFIRYTEWRRSAEEDAPKSIVHFINLDKITTAEWDAKESILTLAWDADDGSSEEVLLHGDESASAAAILDSLCSPAP